MKTFVSVTVLLTLGNLCLALPPSSTQARAPAKIKQTTPIPTTHYAIVSSSSSSSSPSSTSSLPSTTSQTPSVSLVTNIEQRTKNTDQTTSASIQTRKSSTPSTQEATSSTASQQQTTSASLAKETRESTGKNRPQIKITTNYTNIDEVSFLFHLSTSRKIEKFSERQKLGRSFV